MEKLRKILLEAKGIDNFQRVDPTHPVAWYLGLDSSGKYSLFCITMTKPQQLTSTQIIKVFVGKRHDGQFGITFSLQEKVYLNVFLHFCEDMIDNTRRITDPIKVSDAVCGRYIQWQKAFRRTRGELLGFEVVKGLIGEMLFLKTKAIKKYGSEKALHGWSGIDYTDRDFTYDDYWYEVKTTVTGSDTVKISSLGQLDVPDEGYLVVLFLDKTSKEDSSRITINKLFTSICNDLDSVVLQEEFKSRLLEFGYYPDEAYDEFCFSFHGLNLYRVPADFPCIRKTDIPTAITDVEYYISLPSIENYREE